jgi:cell division protein FtsN
VDTSQLKTSTFFFGGLIGFVTGLVVAGVLAIWIYQSTPFRPEATPHTKLEPVKPRAEVKATGQTGELAKDEKKTEAERIVPPGAKPDASPAASAPAVAATPAPAPKATAKLDPAQATPSPDPSPSAEPRSRLWLQVGAYVNRQDAESQRARFAVLGYEAQIQSADIPEKGTVHRVRVGPYRDPDEAGKVRGDLARQGIEVTVIKP